MSLAAPATAPAPQDETFLSLPCLSIKHHNRSTLVDVGHELIRHRQSLPQDLRMLRMHQHFGLTSEDHKKLEVRTLKTTRFITYFFDTKDFKLAHNNWWLILQDDIWTLKKCNKSSTEHFVIYYAERNLSKIEAEVAQMLGLPSGDGIEQLCPNEFAILRTERRIYYDSPSWRLYVDSVELADNDYYLVGTLSLSADEDIIQEWPKVLSEFSVFSPVRSRVAEFIHGYLPELANALVVGGILLEGPFYSAQGLNHHLAEPFRDEGGKDLCLLLPSLPIDLPTGNDKESRSPSDEDKRAHKEWIRWCKENSELEERYFGQ